VEDKKSVFWSHSRLKDDFLELKEAIMNVAGSGWPLVSRLVLDRLRKARLLHYKAVWYSYVTDRELRSMIVSQTALPRLYRLLPRRVRFASLEGSDALVFLGKPPEQIYRFVRISPSRFKCTCEDAIMMTSIAERRLNKILESLGVKAHVPAGSLSDYSLCKHTLSEIARAKRAGVLDFEEKEFRNTLTVALLVLALKYLDEQEVKKKMLELVLRAVRTVLERAGGKAAR